MANVIAETIRLICFAAVCLYLWYVVGKEGLRGEWGWPYIFGAFLLFNIGLLISVTEDFPSLSKFMILGDSPYEPYVKNLVVFVPGFILLILGIAGMIPPAAALKKAQVDLRESHAHLEKQVEARTAEIRLSNEKLLSEISERKAAEEALRKAHDELEDRVRDRTADLEKANEELQAEISRRNRIEEDLRESEERYRLLAEYSLIGVYLHQDPFFVYVNQRVERMLGYSAKELTRTRFWEIFHPEIQEQIKARGLARYRGEKELPVYESRLVTKDGDTRLVEISAVPTLYRGRAATIGTFIDITDRKRAEEALRESEERYRTLVDLLPIGVGIHSEGRVVFVNRTAAKIMSAKTPEELIGKPVLSLVAPESQARSLERIRAMMQTWQPAPVDEIKFVQSDGTVRDAEIYATPIMEGGKPAVLVASLDVTERKASEERIKASLKEKEVMLREIHHRVKNNLAVIVSLLGLQSHYTSDESARRMFEETQARIRSMALAHEVLYQSENLADVQIAEYLANLTDHICMFTADVGTTISLEREIEDISCGLDTAIPVGFIVTELLSNCLKHAFPDRREGQIRISLRSLDKNAFELVVADNGVGVPAESVFRSPTSLGLELVQTFVHQLHGDLEIRRENGTQVRVRLKEIKKRDWRQDMDS